MAFDNTAYMTNLADNAQKVGNLGYTGFGQSTQVGANPYQQNAWESTYNRGMQGSSAINAASGQVENTINGLGFSSNPFISGSNPQLQNAIDSSLGDMTRNYNMAVKPQTESAMAGSGSFGNSGLQQIQGEQQRNLMSEMGKTASNMRYADYMNQNNNWNQERDRQMAAINQAPMIANADYTDLNAMQQAGNSMQGQAQGERTAAYNQYLDAREWPFKTLGAQTSSLNGGNIGSATYQQQQPQSNSTANALGGALAGYSMGGWGGAALGGLAGLLG